MLTLKPLGAAMQMNLAAAIRTRRRGYRGWAGAINTGYDPLDPATAAQPFAAYRALHRGGRVHYNPRRATWILHRLDDVRAALRATDKVTSSQGVTRIRMAADLVVVTDGEQHSRLRRQVQPAFTKRALDSWREVIGKLATELVDDVLADPGCDVVTQLAIPVPLRLIAGILGIPGIPGTDIADFRPGRSAACNSSTSPPPPNGLLRVAKATTAVIALRRYFLQQLDSGHLKDSGTLLGATSPHGSRSRAVATSLGAERPRSSRMVDLAPLETDPVGVIERLRSPQ